MLIKVRASPSFPPPSSLFSLFANTGPLKSSFFFYLLHLVLFIVELLVPNRQGNRFLPLAPRPPPRPQAPEPPHRLSRQHQAGRLWPCPCFRHSRPNIHARGQWSHAFPWKHMCVCVTLIAAALSFVLRRVFSSSFLFIASLCSLSPFSVLFSTPSFPSGGSTFASITALPPPSIYHLGRDTVVSCARNPTWGAAVCLPGRCLVYWMHVR